MAHTAEVWLSRPLSCPVQVLALYLACLSRQEREQLSGLRFEPDRTSYLVAHGMLRHALTQYCKDVSPAGWSFEIGPHGRPEVAHAGSAGQIRFNLSHTRTLVACVVMRSVPCGIDVEYLDRHLDVHELLHTTLSESERVRFASIPTADHAARFFRHWTLKEAYVKAIGLGLLVPFDKISFELDQDIALSLDASLAAHSTSFKFEQWVTTDRHMVSVALGSPSCRLVCHDADYGPDRITAVAVR